MISEKLETSAKELFVILVFLAAPAYISLALSDFDVTKVSIKWSLCISIILYVTLKSIEEWVDIICYGKSKPWLTGLIRAAYGKLKAKM